MAGSIYCVCTTTIIQNWDSWRRTFVLYHNHGQYHVFLIQTHITLHVSSFLPPGWLGPQHVLEGQPVGDDPHVPLPHGANLLHVVGHLEPLDGHQCHLPPGPSHPFLHGPRPPHPGAEPHLDSQEDHAAAEPRGLELQQQGSAQRLRGRGTVWAPR